MVASIIAAWVLSGQVAGKGWYRVQVDVPTPAILQRLENTDLSLLDCIPHLGTADVAIGPSQWASLKDFKYKNVTPIEDPRNWETRHPSGSARVSDEYRFSYFNADQILAFFEELRAEHPGFITRIAIGTSINGETMWAYQFDPGAPRLPGQPVNNIVVQGLIHAREWITGSCIMHIARKVADELPDDIGPNPHRVANQVTWVIPMVNPDGYRYTWATNRLWRKNRRHNSGGSFGVDLNRNFSKGWGANNGSSGSQSSDTYRGTAAFSEPETQAVRNLCQSLGRVGGFIDYHSYAQLILEPWGYTTAASPDSGMFTTVGNALQGPMSSYGATYQAGECSNILYIASGISNDWVYSAFGTPAFGIELRDTGQFGFELPASQIYSTQDEVWAGFDQYRRMMGP